MNVNIKSTYFGFTNNLKPMQAARKEKTLNRLIRFNDNMMTEKEFIYTLLQEGLTPTIEENYSYYSRKLDDYTKPKTDYRLTDQEGAFYSITKTSYDFAQHILNNNFQDTETASNYILQEKQQKDEQERLEREKAEKERQEREEKERIEKEKQEALRQEKINRWTKLGNEVITDDYKNMFVEVIKNNFTKYNIEASEEDKNQFITERLEKLPLILGNPDYIIHTLQFYVEKGHKRNSFNSLLIEEEFLFNVFNISLEDSRRKIAVKVKAYYENKQLQTA